MLLMYKVWKYIIICGVDNSPSSHADNLINNFLILGEGDSFGINGSFDAPEKKLSINFSKANTKFWLSLHCNADNSYLFVNRKEIFKANILSLKPTIKILTFQHNFVWKEFLMDLVIFKWKCV